MHAGLGYVGFTLQEMLGAELFGFQKWWHPPLQGGRKAKFLLDPRVSRVWLICNK